MKALIVDVDYCFCSCNIVFICDMLRRKPTRIELRAEDKHEVCVYINVYDDQQNHAE